MPSEYPVIKIIKLQVRNAVTLEMDPERLALYKTPAVLSLVVRIQARMRGLLQRARCRGHGAHAEEERSLPIELRRGALMGERSPRGSPRRLGHMSTSRHLSTGAVLGT